MVSDAEQAGSSAGVRMSIGSSLEGSAHGGAAMTREGAEQLIEAYLASWVRRDSVQFLSVLSDDAVVVECDGRSYLGEEQLRRWFADWHAAPACGWVNEWEVLRIYYDEAQCIATVEWNFRCVWCGEETSFLGASVILFHHGKIAQIHEYRMDKSESEKEDGWIDS